MTQHQVLGTLLRQLGLATEIWVSTILMVPAFAGVTDPTEAAAALLPASTP